MEKKYTLAIAIIAIGLIVAIILGFTISGAAWWSWGDEVEEAKYFCCGDSEDDRNCAGAYWNKDVKCSSGYNIWASCCTNRVASCEEQCTSKGYESYELVKNKGSTGDPSTHCKCSGEVEEKACTDSDDGKNYYVKGTATDSNSLITDVCQITDDSEGKVVTTGILYEYFCDSNISLYTIVNFDEYTCPNGCKDGACISEEVTYQGVLDMLNKCTILEIDMLAGTCSQACTNISKTCVGGGFLQRNMNDMGNDPDYDTLWRMDHPFSCNEQKYFGAGGLNTYCICCSP